MKVERHYLEPSIRPLHSVTLELPAEEWRALQQLAKGLLEHEHYWLSRVVPVGGSLAVLPILKVIVED